MTLVPIAVRTCGPADPAGDGPATGGPADPAGDGTATGDRQARHRGPAARHGVRPPAPPVRAWLPVVVGCAVLTGLVLGDVEWPVVRSLLTAWLFVAVPARHLGAKLRWRVQGTERLVLSLALVLLGALSGALALNTLLPVLGVARPLDPAPTVLAADVAVLALLTWRRGRVPAPVRRARWHHGALVVPWPAPDVALVGGSAVAVLLAVAGAVRLNNGGDGAVTSAALVTVTVVFVAALVARGRVREPALHLCVYGQSLALLLMTSLRGWHITGHDIQREFHVMQLTSAAGHWDVEAFRDAYNACLSITVLPTVITNVTGGPPEAAFKVWTQLIFALTPVVVFLIARRSTTVGVSLLGAVFFVAFPTYFTDMPYLNRQEVAFAFVAVAILTIVLREESLGRRRLLFALFSAGTVLSHYSTTYVLIGVALMAAGLRLTLAGALPLLPSRLRWLHRMRRMPVGRWRRTRLVVGPLNIALLIAMSFAWSGLLTHTDHQLLLTAQATLDEVLHPGTEDARSSDVTYNLLAGGRFDPAQRLRAYRDRTLTTTAEARARGEYYPTAVLDRYPAPVTEPPQLPLTTAGRALDAVHVDAAAVNATIRSGAAKLLQVFVCVGLLALALNAVARFKPLPELVLLGVASFAVVVSQVVLPQVSVDYGVLRAFQQSLIVLAPFLATGAMMCLRPLRAWADRAAAAFTIAFLVSLTGLQPQLTGGYPAQLNLNDAGLYYDIYYPHDQELAATRWLFERAHQAGADVQTDRYTAARLPGLVDDGTADIYPTQLRTDRYVLLGWSTVRSGRAVVTVLGDQLTYHYPRQLLQDTRNLVYDNGGAEVYR